jgi:O-antigen/teichoic acid export membrane protein
MLGDAGGRGCAALVLLTGWWRGRRDVEPPVGRRDVVSAARRFRRFPLISSWSSLLNNAGVYVPTVLIASLYGTHVGGLFGLGQRVFALPLGLVGTAVAQAYLAHSANGRATGDGAQLALYRSTRRRLAVLGLLATFGVLAAGGRAFAAVFGEPWREAGVYCQLLAPMLLAQFVAVPLAVALDLVERQDLHAWWDAGRLVVVAAAFGVARALGFSPRGALLLYSLASAATYTVLLGVIQHGLRGATGARPARAVS